MKRSRRNSPGGGRLDGRARRAGLARQRRRELRRRDLAEQVVLVVDRRQRDVDLARPVVRAAAPARRRDALVALDELPPDRAEILVGVAVELALEARHDLHPGREDEQLAALHLGVARIARDRGRDAGEALEERLVAHQPPVQHRDRLGRERVRGLAQQPRQLRVDREVVDGVAELVHHRREPARPRLAVREHAHVVAAVDVGAERVLVLAVARVEVAARDHAVDVVAERLEVAAGDLDRIEVLERRLERVVAGRRRILEERIRVVPGLQRLAVRDAEARALALVDRGLGALPGRRQAALEVVEQAQQPGLVELVERQREREVVAIAERAARPRCAGARARARAAPHAGRSTWRHPRPRGATRDPTTRAAPSRSRCR